MKHLKSINESEEPKRIKVKHLIEYLSKLDPEMNVNLDKDGWDYYDTEKETVERSYLFYVSPGYGGHPPHLTINN